MDSGDDLVHDFGRLTVEEEEVQVFSDERCLEAVKGRGPCLAGSFLFPVNFNNWAMKLLFKKLWSRDGEEVKIHEPLPNRFFVEFPSDDAMQRVLEGGPWLFDNNLLLLQPWNPSSRVDDLIFESVLVWVQVRNLPWFLREEEDVRLAVKTLGEIIQVDSRVLGSDDGDYMRVRVRIALDKPLRRGGYIMALGNKLWLDYRYEKIPNLCGWCGCIGHVTDDCSNMTEEGKKLQKPGYGDWLLYKPLVKSKSRFFDGEGRMKDRFGSGREEAWCSDGWEEGADRNLGEEEMGVEEERNSAEMEIEDPAGSSVIKAHENPLANHTVGDAVPKTGGKISKEAKGKAVMVFASKAKINSKRKAADANVSPTAKLGSRDKILSTGRDMASSRGRGRGQLTADTQQRQAVGTHTAAGGVRRGSVGGGSTPTVPGERKKLTSPAGQQASTAVTLHGLTQSKTVSGGVAEAVKQPSQLP